MAQLKTKSLMRLLKEANTATPETAQPSSYVLAAIDGDLTLDQYCSDLTQRFWVHLCLEDNTADILTDDQVRSPMIENDLMSLDKISLLDQRNLLDPTFELVNYILELRDTDDLFGVLYVLERSLVVAGPTLALHIGNCLKMQGLDLQGGAASYLSGTSYFSGNADGREKMKAFGRKINREITNPALKEKVVDVARNTYSLLDRMYESIMQE